MRIVLDTDVLVAAVTSPRGASRALLERILRGDGVTLAASIPLFLEYEAVLTRPERLSAAGATSADILLILDAMSQFVHPVGFDFRWRPQSTDPADDMVLETAINGYASVIATFNSRHLRMAAQQFGIAAEPPGRILRRLS